MTSPGELPSRADVVIIGAGLAGLAAARYLTQRGVDTVVIDAADRVGGRVTTDEVGGFLLDRGFQLHNPAYPEAARVLDQGALDLRPFLPGVVVSLGRATARVGDPRALPSWSIDSARAPLGTPWSKAAFGIYALKCATAKVSDLQARADTDARTALLSAGVSHATYDRLLYPFLAGVFLTDPAHTSRRFLDLVFRSFINGTPSVPANGMRAIPEQLAARLPNTPHLGTRVREITTGTTDSTVTTEQGRITTRAVVVATDAESAADLLPDFNAPKTLDVTTWYHVAEGLKRADLRGGDAVLTVDGLRANDFWLLNTVPITHAAPTYDTTGAGRVLVSSSALGLHDDSATERQVRERLTMMYDVDATEWTLVTTYPIRGALPAMTPPFAVQRPISLGGGLFVAGDHRDTSSIQGALVSGRRAATAALKHIRGKVSS